MKIIIWDGYRRIAWVGLIMLALEAVVAVLRGNLSAVLLLGGALLFSAVIVLWLRALPPLFALLLIVIVLLNANGFAWQLFRIPGPYDEITHAVTIFSITFALGALIYGPRLRSLLSSHILFVLTIASLGLALGALWEVVEWFLDMIPGIQVFNSLSDTIIDLMVDTLGAFIAGLLSLWVMHEERQHGKFSPK